MARTPRRMDKRRRRLRQWAFVSAAVTFVVTAVVVRISVEREAPVAAANANIEGLTSVLTKRVSADEVTIRLTDVTAASGIDFQHMPCRRASLLPEDMGSGVAAADYDGDGLTDLYFVNIAGNAIAGAPIDASAGRSRLYRNMDGMRFKDVTEQAGVGFVGIGMGAAWGDYDDDGDLDLYLTAFGANALYRNEGNGTFVDVIDETRTQDERFSTGCSWSDFDRDGDIDLYVSNYVDFVYRVEDRDTIERQYATEQPFTLNPSSFAPQPNALFVNNGDGTFTERGAELGVANASGRSLSASWADLDNDGWVDLYVANDVSNNGVFLNRCKNGSCRFKDAGASSLAADYRGAMGLAVADIDDDGDQDLLVTHWIAQENALYRNMLLDKMLGDAAESKLWFIDDADACGLGQSSLDMVGWATGFVDFDNDGRKDLWILNGSTMEQPQDHALLKRQPGFLFWNHQELDMVDVTRVAAPDLHRPAVYRGGAHADLDRDGRVDLVVLEHGGPARILENVTEVSGDYLRIELRQQGANTAALGSRVYVSTAGTTQMAEVGASSSYLSQDETTLHFGLGRSSQSVDVEIHWPDGIIDCHPNVNVNQAIRFSHHPDYAVRSGF